MKLENPDKSTFSAGLVNRFVVIFGTCPMLNILEINGIDGIDA